MLHQNIEVFSVNARSAPAFEPIQIASKIICKAKKNTKEEPFFFVKIKAAKIKKRIDNNAAVYVKMNIGK